MAYKKYVDKDHYVKDSMGSDFFGELGSSYNLAKKISTKITGHDPMDELHTLNNNDFDQMDELKLRKKLRKLRIMTKMGATCLAVGLIGLILNPNLIIFGILGAFILFRDGRGYKRLKKYIDENYS